MFPYFKGLSIYLSVSQALPIGSFCFYLIKTSPVVS